MRSYLDALLRYFEFSGRTSRAQYWLYNFVVLIIFAAAIGYQYYQLGRFPHRLQLDPLMIFITLFHAVPGITVAVRRLHDIGRSGWWYLLNLVPFGSLVIFVWSFYPSEPGSNDYGDPSGGGGTSRANSRRPEPEPYYARALRPSAASGRTPGNIRLDGSSERFI